MWIPEMAREITSRWISDVPSKMAWVWLVGASATLVDLLLLPET